MRGPALLAAVFLAGCASFVGEGPPASLPVETAPVLVEPEPEVVRDFDLDIAAVTLLDARGRPLPARANPEHRPGFEGNAETVSPDAYVWASGQPVVLSVQVVNLTGEARDVFLRALWPPFSGVEAQAVRLEALGPGEGALLSFPAVEVRPSAGLLRVDLGLPAPEGDLNIANDHFETPIFVE